jgi:hypothetical protein
MQSALGRANIVIEGHRVKLVTVIWATGNVSPLIRTKSRVGRDRNWMPSPELDYSFHA